MRALLISTLLFSTLLLFSTPPEWYTFTTSNSGLPHQNINEIVIEDGVKYIASSGGLSIYNDTSWVLINAQNGLPSNVTNSIAVKGEVIWVGTLFSGVAYYNGSTWTTYTQSDGLPYNTVYDVTIDQNDMVWFATPQAIASFDGSQWTPYNTGNTTFFPSSTIYDIEVNSNNQKWLAAESAGSFQGGIALLNPSGPSCTTYRTFNGLISNEITTIAIDPSDNVWAGSYNGLSYFNGNSFTNYTSTDGLPDDWVKSLAIDSQGNLWVGTNNGLGMYDGVSWSVFNTSNSDLPNNNVKALAIDQNDNVWIGTTSGVSVFKPGGLVPTSSPTKATITGTTSLCEGDSTYLHIEISGGVAPFNVSLSNGKTYTNLSTKDSVSVQPTSTTTYSLTLVEDAFNNVATSLAGNAEVTVNTIPTVTLDDFANTTICEGGTEPLPLGTPLGGVYTGSGVSGGVFDAASTGTGIFKVYYSYTNALNCSAEDSTTIQVDVCTQIDNEKLDGPSMYPNPVVNSAVINYPESFQAEVYSLSSQLILSFEGNNKTTFNTNQLKPGAYILIIQGVESGRIDYMNFVVQ